MTFFSAISTSKQLLRVIGYLAVCTLSPFVFLIVQAGIARLTVPALLAFGVSSATGVSAAIASTNVLGALIAAALLCLPLGRFAPKRPALLGAITIVWIWLPPKESAVFSGLRWLELAAFVGGCIVFSLGGAKVARRVAA